MTESGTIIPASRRRAWLGYALGTAILAVGIPQAARRYPGETFDWAYTVISALASWKHNPEGAPWFATALALAMACLWPAVTFLTRGGRAPRAVTLALRLGVVCGVFVGVERLVFYHFSTQVKKGHEILALVAFLSFYVGLVGLYLHRARKNSRFRWSAAVVIAPLLGVGWRELTLYLAQRSVGWSDHNWRGQGLPLWMSFALWQWLAAALLWLAVGHLLATTEAARAGESPAEVGSL